MFTTQSGLKGPLQMNCTINVNNDCVEDFGSSNDAIIRTFSGEMFDIAHPSPSKVMLIDIAHHLALINRFTGATRVPENVAQHSVLVSYLVPKGMELDGLFHDAAEAYVADLNSPLKKLLPDYKTIENKVFSAIARKFALSDPAPRDVKEADGIAYLMERRMHFDIPVPDGILISPRAAECLRYFWSWQYSEERWLDRYHELITGRQG